MNRPRKFRRLTIWIVFIHAGVVLVHGLAHREQGIETSFAANLFIVLVIIIGPFAGLILLRRGPHRSGALTLVAAMAGSFLFGLWNHFLVHGADHITEIQNGSWKLPFQVTALLLLVTEFAGCAIAFALLHEGSLPASRGVTDT